MSIFPVLRLTAPYSWLLFCLSQWDATNGGFWMKNYFLFSNREHRQLPRPTHPPTQSLCCHETLGVLCHPGGSIAMLVILIDLVFECAL